VTADKPHVLVLLAAHEGADWLGEQLASILRQTEVEVSLLISVDCSVDDTEEIVESAAAADSRIRVLPYGQHFGSAALNFFRLVREAELDGIDYVAFADQDDIWDLDKLHHAVMQLAEQNADAYSANVCAFWPDGRRRLIRKSQPQRQWDFLFEAAGPGCTYVFSRQLFDDLQRLVVARSGALQAVDLHDWFFYAFARSRGFRWFIDPQAKMSYRQHANNVVGVNRGARAVLARTRRIVSGWWISQARIIASILGLAQEPFVAKWIVPGQRIGYLHLAIHAYQCRRQVSDATFMALLMVFLSIVNPVGNADRSVIQGNLG
jgi:rhamnosyltransferase